MFNFLKPTELTWTIFMIPMVIFGFFIVLSAYGTGVGAGGFIFLLFLLIPALLAEGLDSSNILFEECHRWCIFPTPTILGMIYSFVLMGFLFYLVALIISKIVLYFKNRGSNVVH